MSHYIKKYRYQFAGVALPVFLLFVLLAVGVSVFPGWIRPSYGTPGASCATEVFDTNSTALLTACDCNTEVCLGNFGTALGTCIVASPAIPAPCDLQISTGAIPGCWNSCVSSVQQLGSSGSGTFDVTFQCLPNNNFCNGISGGTAANACRTGACTPVSTPDAVNPSGCDYTLNSDADCKLCVTPAPSTFNHCGNGICEPGLGETATSCAVDCEAPGMPPGPLPTPGGDLDLACESPAGIHFITFGGPPYNVPFSGSCEDGNLCTVDTCSQGTCSSTPASCSGNTGDFCCPAGCVPPTSGGTCTVGNNCDIDCYTPQQCIQPSPTPTPNPTPPVILGGCVQGSGISAGSNGNLGCKGFTCHLNPEATRPEGTMSWLLASTGLCLAFGLYIRRQQAR